MNIQTIFLEQTNSTNSYLASLPPTHENQIRVVYTAYQTNGRGQGTNKWESEPHKNLLFSFDVMRPPIPVEAQFYLSMACALAVKKALSNYVSNLTLKWPNDIYVDDKKICGILIELNIDKQSIKRCVFGVGININQAHFKSDAPNPVSLFQLIGKETNLQEVLQHFIKAFLFYYNKLQNGHKDFVYRSYKASLYRQKGWYRYKDSKGTFRAKIKEVLANGTLLLEDEQGIERFYAFKEVNFVLEK